MSKKAKKAGKNSINTNRPSPSVRESYALSVARAALQAVRDLEAYFGHPVGKKRVVNYLRGNQPPPPACAETKDTSPRDAYALLWIDSASWVEELLERLNEEGYLETTLPPRGGWSLTHSGVNLLTGEESIDVSILPGRPALGTHPELEERLRGLRRRIAKEVGRPPYGVFSNATLAYLAVHRPRDMGALSATPGLGEQRLRKFGRRILRVLKKKVT